MEPVCPFCHQIVRDSDFYCSSCGRKLHEKPLPTSIFVELLYYLGSILLPPLGIFWGIKYLKQNDEDAKRIGLLSIVFTVISFIVTIIWTMSLIRSISSQADTILKGNQELLQQSSPF